MITFDSALQKLALVLMLLALRILPPSGEEYGKAMLSEFFHRDNCREALSWAAGCLTAGINMRYETMITGNLKISHWILVPELLICFLPLTRLWVDVNFSAYGIFRQNLDFVQQNIFRFPEDTAFTVMIVTMAILSTIGPAGLVAAFRLIVLKQPIQTRAFGFLLITGPVVLGIVTVICLLLSRSVAWLDELGLILLLFTILPSAGAAHLYYFSYSKPSESITA